MITKANFILVATVADGKYVFEYEVPEMMEALEKFWHEDYPQMLADLKGSELFPMDVMEVRSDLGGKVITFKIGFIQPVFHHFFDKGWKCDSKGNTIKYTTEEFQKDLLKIRVQLDSEKKFRNDATSLMFYMWNRWCLEECKIVFKDGDWNHFWNKWCGYNSEYGRFGAVEDFYASLTNDNRDKLVKRACEMYDGSREKY